VSATVPANLEHLIDEAFRDFARRVEEISQTAAGTEAVLFAKDRIGDEDWQRAATFEYELSYEVRYWEHVQAVIAERLRSRKQMRDAQIEKRQAEREG